MHALQHLERFFSSLLSAKEFWAAILGAFIGGLLTGWFALRAQKQSARDQRQRDREAEHRAVNDTLRALETELRTLNELLIQGGIRVLRTWEQEHHKTLPLNISATNQNYFIVFDSSAAALGRIEDNELRRKIIDTFYRAKGFVDAANHQNQQYQEWDRLRRGPEAHLSQQLLPELQRWVDVVIRGNLDRLETLVPELLDDIEKYLKQHL